MKPNEIAEIAMTKMNKKITDEIFLIIQNDRELMHKYLRAVEEYGLDTLNKQIGKAVKARYHLENIDDREYEPKSTLILSHQKFD